MRLITRVLVVLFLGVGGLTALPSSSAFANTLCTDANAGVASSGSTYWGWCHPNGGYVYYRLTVLCPNGWGGGTTAWASGSGYGAIYTNSETCWFGAYATAAGLENG